MVDLDPYTGIRVADEAEGTVFYYADEFNLSWQPTVGQLRRIDRATALRYVLTKPLLSTEQYAQMPGNVPTKWVATYLDTMLHRYMALNFPTRAVPPTIRIQGDIGLDLKPHALLITVTCTNIRAYAFGFSGKNRFNWTSSGEWSSFYRAKHLLSGEVQNSQTQWEVKTVLFSPSIFSHL